MCRTRGIPRDRAANERRQQPGWVARRHDSDAFPMPRISKCGHWFVSQRKFVSRPSPLRLSEPGSPERAARSRLEAADDVPGPVWSFGSETVAARDVTGEAFGVSRTISRLADVDDPQMPAFSSAGAARSPSSGSWSSHACVCCVVSGLPKRVENRLFFDMGAPGGISPETGMLAPPVAAGQPGRDQFAGW